MIAKYELDLWGTHLELYDTLPQCETCIFVNIDVFQNLFINDKIADKKCGILAIWDGHLGVVYDTSSRCGEQFEIPSCMTKLEPIQGSGQTDRHARWTNGSLFSPFFILQVGV